MKRIFAFALLLLAPMIASATEPTLHSDGLWYWQGFSTGYRLVTPAAVYSCGRVIQPASYYQAVYTPPATVNVTVNTPAPPTYSADWKTQALKYAEALDDRQAFLKVMSAIGVNYSGYGNAVLPANASTPFGYTYSSLASVYGDLSLPQLYQQSAQLANGAQRFGAEATAGHQGLVREVGSNLARVQEILAKGEASARVVKSFAGPNTVEQKVTVTGQLPLAQPEQVAAPQAQDAPKGDRAALSAMLGAKCASCHFGANKKGGLDISQYLNFTAEQRANVWQRVMSRDPKTVMPPPPAAPLGMEELKLFLTN